MFPDTYIYGHENTFPFPYSGCQWRNRDWDRRKK